MTNKKDIKFEKGSGNVFADLGLEHADEMYTRSCIGYHVIKAIKDQKLEQKNIVKALKIDQSDVSRLMNGNFNRFSAEKLMDFLNRLELKVAIQISEHHKGEPYQQVAYVHALA